MNNFATQPREAKLFIINYKLSKTGASEAVSARGAY